MLDFLRIIALMPFALLDKKVSIEFKYIFYCTTCSLDINMFKAWQTGFVNVETLYSVHE